MELLRRLRRRLERPGPGVQVPVGDDAAVLRAVGPRAVLCIDTLVEDQDFRLRWATFGDVGHKAAAVNLSDLAAMGAQPRGLLLSLALRPQDPVAGVMALVNAADRLGRLHGAPLVGGDLSATTGPLVVTITGVGQQHTSPLLRRKARRGDWVAVTGWLGEAAAGLWGLERGLEVPASLRRRQLRPQPQVQVGQALARGQLVRSAADLSDGLVRDAGLLVEGELGVELHGEALPVRPLLRRWCESQGLSAAALAAAGGEDFVLVVAVEPSRWQAAAGAVKRAGGTLTRVGTVVPGRGVRWQGEAPTTGRGFEHFRSA